MMFSSSRLLLLPFVCVQLVFAKPMPHPMITAAPVPYRRAASSSSTDIEFIGWYSTDGTYEADDCGGGSTMSFSSTFAVCCDETASSCDFITSCGSSYEYYETGSSSCGDEASCNTDYIFTTMGDTDPWLWLGCSGETQHLYYIENPASAAATTTTDTESSTSQVSSSSSASASSTTHSPSATLASAASATTTPAALPTPTPQPKSKAWIAGAVVGPVAAMAIIGLLFWVFRLKRRNKQPKYQPAPQASQMFSPPPQGYQQQPYDQYKGAYSPPMANVSPLQHGQGQWGAQDMNPTAWQGAYAQGQTQQSLSPETGMQRNTSTVSRTSELPDQQYLQEIPELAAGDAHIGQAK